MKEDDHIFTDEEIAGLVELGEVLRGIHKRLISEGWTIKDGIFTTSDGVSYTKETMGQYHEDQKKKRKAELKAKRQHKND